MALRDRAADSDFRGQFQTRRPNWMRGNAAISRRFGHKAWSPRAETAHESGIPVPCLRARYFGVSFYEARGEICRLLSTSVRLVRPLRRREDFAPVRNQWVT